MIISYSLPLLFFTIVLFFQNCVTTPGSERKQLILMPEGQMAAMGEQSYLELRKKEKVSADKALTEKIVKIGKDIAKASGADFKWEFTLFESENVNAFCLPGGKIGVYTGILPIAKTNAGLAAVLGHEVAHATARHGNERVSQQLLVSGSLMALNVAMKDEKKRNVLMAAIGLGAQFGVLLPYSRKQESEADLIGLNFMAKAGYDPTEASKLWERMAKLGKSPPEWLSTHPNSLSRAETLRKKAPDVAGIFERSAKKPTQNL